MWRSIPLGIGSGPYEVNSSQKIAESGEDGAGEDGHGAFHSANSSVWMRAGGTSTSSRMARTWVVKPGGPQT